jgi:drug/metabolite transporter (DMT)-like permease
MALYNVWSRPLMQRSSMMGFLATGMGAGAALSVGVAWYSSGFETAATNFGAAQWWAIAFLGLFASLVAAAVIGEPIGIELLGGIAAVGAGIWIAART